MVVLPACPPGGGGAPGGRYITMMDTIPPVRGSGAVVVDITCPPASLRSSLVVAPAPSWPSRLSANKSRGVRKLIRFHCNLVKQYFDKNGPLHFRSLSVLETIELTWRRKTVASMRIVTIATQIVTCVGDCQTDGAGLTNMTKRDTDQDSDGTKRPGSIAPKPEFSH